MTLTDVALRISRHLNRFAADPTIASKKWVDGAGVERALTLYWSPVCYRGGAYVMVKYVGYQHQSALRRDEAERYLAWLDEGNIGRSYDVPPIGKEAANADQA